jgi:hypothetical protein
MKDAGIWIGVALLTIGLSGCGESEADKGPAGATPAPAPPPDLQKAFLQPGTKAAPRPVAPASPDASKKS